MKLMRGCYAGLALVALSGAAFADENLFGYTKGAETLPKGANEFVQHLTVRDDKGTGSYRAIDSKTEFEHGVTDKFTVAGYLKAQSIDTSGLLINGYLPGDKEYGMRVSGIEASAKYNYLSPAKDDFGLASYFSLSYDWLDPHSGQDKKKVQFEAFLIGQKYFMEGQLIWAGNVGLEATYAKRGAIDDLPAGFEWSTDPEMEIGFTLSTGLTYRFAPGWYAGAEVVYDTEFETEVGQERWSVFAGPTLHYANKEWWLTASWMPQIRGGGEKYPGQPDSNLHLIEKTKDEYRLKVGFNF